LLAALALGVAVAGAAVAFRDELAAWALADRLEARGIEPIGGPEVEVGLRGAVVRNLRAEGGLSIDRVAATYSLLALLRTGRVAELTVSGLSARGTVGPGGAVEIAGLPSLAEGGPSGAWPDPPFRRLALTDAHLGLDTPAGPVDLALAADARAGEGGIAVAGLAGAVHADGTLSLAFEGRAGPRGRGEILFEIEGGQARRGDLRLDGLRGWLAVEFEDGVPAALGGELAAARLAVGEATFAPVRLLVLGTPWPDLVALRAGGPGASRLAVDARRVATEPGPIGLHADLAVPSLAAAAARLAELPPADASLALRLDAEARPANPRDPLRPGDWAAEGRVRLSAGGAHLGDVFRGGSLFLDSGFNLDGRRVRLAGRAPWRIAAMPEGPGVPVAATLEGVDATIAWGGRPALAIDAALALTAGAAGEAARGALSLAAVRGAEAWRVEGLTLDLSGGALDFGRTTVRPRTLAVRGAGGADDFAADLTVDLGVDGAAGGIAELSGGRLALSGRLRRTGESIRFDPAGCIAVSAEALAIDATTRLPRGLSLCLEGDGDPPMRLVLADGRPAGWRAAFTTDDLATLVDAGGERIDLHVPLLEVSAERGEGAARARLVLRGAAVDLPLSDVAVEEMDATLTLLPGGGPAADIVVGDALGRLTGDPPRVAPVRLTGRGEIDGRWRRLAFSASGVGAEAALRLEGEGEISLVGGGGHVEVAVEPIAFAPGFVRAAEVFPIVAATPIVSVEGAVHGEGRYGWGAMRARDARIRLEEVDLVTEYGAMSGIDAELAVADFFPVTLPPGQLVTIRAVDLGLLFERGEFVFGVPDGRRLDVSTAKLDWLGGVVTADPFSVSLDDPGRTITLRAAGVELDRLLGQIPLSGLSATGTLRGVVPLRLTGDIILIDDAVLEAIGPGVIRYRPEGPLPEFGDETGSVDLLLEAAENFHYEDLSLAVSGRTGEALEARLRLVGGNPDLFDGYPVALNVNLEGALDQILRRGIAVSNVGEFTRAYFERLSEGVVTDDFIEELQRLGE
jgi:hypothetical protein